MTTYEVTLASKQRDAIGFSYEVVAENIDFAKVVAFENLAADEHAARVCEIEGISMKPSDWIVVTAVPR